MTARRPPNYFGRVRDRARQRWQQLEADPELAGPWKQLFRQVQSPRHVLSELLQNADDVGARHVRVRLAENAFVFEHDGNDFSEEEFDSLCRFGFSNKRQLHTIGFRGIGFKSTFSLGDTVEVLTPTLAVRFHERRFTEPVWSDEAPACDVTRISVAIRDANREKELRKNLREWMESPASLLFFRSVRVLTIDDVTWRKEHLGVGPTAGSERVRLTGGDGHSHEVLVFVSPEEPFPPEAIEEIRRERDVEDLHLPPCSVELVVGLPGEQRVYVVLPTGVRLAAPFSCNAPFLQDPARATIKDLALSPTNRWLLRRIGELAGRAMLHWLGDHALDVETRAQAYGLLPRKPEARDSLEADTISAIAEGFCKEVSDATFLLTAEGQLVRSEECLSPPKWAYSVWTPEEVLQALGDGQGHVLAREVSWEARESLASWGWLSSLDDDGVIERLQTPRAVPRPGSHEALVRLWSFVQQSVRYDWGSRQRRRLAIVPVKGSTVLHAAERVVRLPEKKQAISADAWEFLMGLLAVIDPAWVEFLGQLKDGNDEHGQAAWELLQALNLHRASDAEVIVAHACRRLFAREEASLEDCVRMAHLMAALDARAPEEFLCVTRDGQRRQPRTHGVIAVREPMLEELFPEQWLAEHSLHDAYFSSYTACTRQQWENWVQSEKSGFWPFAQIIETNDWFWGRARLAERLRPRGKEAPDSLPYLSDSFSVEDHDFPRDLLDHWYSMSKSDPDLWAKVLACVLKSPVWYWRGRCKATFFQRSRRRYEQEIARDLPAEWIIRFRGLPCLRDTYGQPHVPAELYLRTPETESLAGVEPFVHADLDREDTKPLLRLLGVRDTPASLDNVLDRIRALAQAPDPQPLLSEIVKWYNALDKSLVRCEAAALDRLRSAFANERLVLTAALGWVKAGEVFQYTSEEYPDAPVIHPAFNHLNLWRRVGVAERPTAQLVLDWLRGLPSGERLDSETSRVRAALQRYPAQVWQGCGHWLALDNTWAPVERLKYRLTMRGLTKWGDLFPAIKAQTANLQMLSAELCDAPPFHSLPDLSDVIVYRVTQWPTRRARQIEQPWLKTLARVLMRVKVDDAAQTRHVREVAARLARSSWYPFEEPPALRVTPYIEGTPAGQAYEPEVFWHDTTIFFRGSKLAKSFGALVNELSRAFSNPQIAEAIKACVARPEEFVIEYMEAHFVLDPEVEDAQARTDLAAALDDGAVADREDEAFLANSASEADRWGYLFVDSDDDAGNEGVTSSNRRQRVRELPLFHRFARSRGFHWVQYRDAFVHPDGRTITRGDSPFHWHLFDPAGQLLHRYWDSAQHWNGRNGVELPAELWELIKKFPNESSLVLLDQGDRPLEVHGARLLEMERRGEIHLVVSRYRLCMTH
ncbi:MAG: hypothetical protein KatS3mg077_0014 [Candidatus Binatia bacterium]|nr:MAG: hypothetical protein KatS3mg077_0014 [Candidatus Binatia bacterium]